MTRRSNKDREKEMVSMIGSEHCRGDFIDGLPVGKTRDFEE